MILIASFFIERFFCKYICPAGALYGIISKISPYKIKRSPCSNCGLCSKKCPMGIDVAKQETVNSAECISCGICVGTCPDKNKPIRFSFFKKSIPLVFAILLSVGAFFGSLFLLDAAGFYQVTVPKISTVIESKEYLKLADLRGSMTIQEGALYTGNDLTKFYEIMEIPLGVSKDTVLKEVVIQVPGYDFHVMKAK